MKRFLLIATLLLTYCVNAQDQIYKKDNTKLSVKILEVGIDEIKYKLWDNLTGPTYIENKRNVDIIIYSNGQHEVIKSSPAAPVQQREPEYAAAPAPVRPKPMDKKDSLLFYRYSHNISINFLNFFNNEIGILYQREFFKSRINIILPFAFGVEQPGITQSVYFTGTGNNGYTLQRKLYEVGFGINYYPSFKTNVNYFIGPMFRYMKYDGIQTFYPYTGMYVQQKNNTLSRFCMTITNGFVIRTRSRLTTTIFGSLGFKSDAINDPITDQYGIPVSSLESPLSLYFWSGFTVGYNF